MAKTLTAIFLMALALLATAKASAQTVLTVPQQVQLVYIGLLGRAADRPGLNYWIGEISNNVLSIEDLRANIVNAQPEYLDGFARLPRDQLVNALYLNLFERDAEPAGLEYWATGGGSGVAIDRLVLALIGGAGADDQATMDLKVAAADSYTQGYQTYDSGAATAAVRGDAVKPKPSNQEFYVANVEQPVVQGRCTSCHVSGGLAGNTRMIFARGANVGAQNYSVLESFLGRSGVTSTFVLNKAQGIGHGGGRQLAPSSQDFLNLKQVLEAIEQ